MEGNLESESMFRLYWVRCTCMIRMSDVCDVCRCGQSAGQPWGQCE